MKAIIENLTGLANFLRLLVRAFLVPHRRQPRPAPRGSSAELVGGLESLFCPKCHVLTARVRQTGNGTEIFQNGRRIIVANNITMGKNGKRQTGFPISCPNGHAVRIPLPARGGG